MKVLWFTNTPSLLSSYYECKYPGNNWVSSLEKALSKKQDVELAIAFIINKKKDKIKINKTTYYPILSTSSKFNKLLNNHYLINNKDYLLKQYLEIIKEYQPDIIQIFGTETNYINICRHTNLPIIIHIQGIISDCYNFVKSSNFSKYEIIKFSKFKELVFGTSLLHKFKLYKKLAVQELYNLNYCHYFFGRTNYDLNFIKANCIDFHYTHCDELLRENFKIREWKLPINKIFRIISINNGEIYKGIDIILNTAQKLTILGFKFEWLIAGIDSNNNVISYFEKKLKIAYSRVNIVLLGKLDEISLITKMINSNIYVHTSNVDNSPNSICEAMMLGMPIIAMDVGGISTLIDNNTGILINKKDINYLADKIIEVSTKFNKLKKIGKYAKIQALTRHNEDKITDTLINTYKNILSLVSTKN